MITFDILEAIPAAGKTAAIINNIVNNNQCAIVASISRDLNRQSYDYYIANGGKNATIIDYDNRDSSSVGKSLENAIRNKTNVIFITHTALLRFENFDHFKGYHLYIDEVPEMVNLEIMRFTYNAYKVLQYCEEFPQLDGVTYNLKLKEELREELESIATDGYYKQDEIAERLLPIYRNLLYGFPIKYVKNDNVSDVFFIEDLSNQDWSVFENVTIACANFYDTFTGCILSNWGDFKFKRSPLHSMLRFHEYDNTSRITIRVVSTDDWSRYTADKLIGKNSVYKCAQECIENKFPTGNYIYTTNTYRPKMQGNQIQYNPHGLNMYSDSTNIVALFSYNPQPWQIPVLRELSVMQGLDEDELVRAFSVSKFLEPVFQLCTRGDMRNNGSDKPITLIVPDSRSAEYLKRNYMKDATIVMDSIVSVPKKYERVKVTAKTAHAFLGFTKKKYPKEYVRFSNHVKRNHGMKLSELKPDNPNHLKLVKDWMIENNIK